MLYPPLSQCLCQDVECINSLNAESVLDSHWLDSPREIFLFVILFFFFGAFLLICQVNLPCRQKTPDLFLKMSSPHPKKLSTPACLLLILIELSLGATQTNLSVLPTYCSTILVYTLHKQVAMLGYRSTSFMPFVPHSRVNN